MGIFEDRLRQAFGFPTKKESLDHSIENYRINELNALNHSTAARNIDISYLEEQIRQLEMIINDNQTFIDNYELIKGNAIEKINQGNSSVVTTIFDKNGNIIASGNYSTLVSYKSSLIRSGASTQTLNEYIYALGEVLDKMWQEYANEVIIGKGVYKGGNRDVDECFPIYTAYNQILNNMNAGRLRDDKRISNKMRDINIALILKSYSLAMRANSILILLLEELKANKDKLASAQASDEYQKRIIEETKQMLASTSEYFMAKQSQEYLDYLDSLKK